MFRGNPRRSGIGVCREFRRDGVCKYGVRCKFSHGPQTGDGRQSGSSQARANPQQSGTRQRQSNQDVKWREWKQILTSSVSLSSRPSEEVARRFFSLALDLMSGDEGASQETIKALADEQGLKFIRDLAERHIPKAQKEQSSLRLWVDEIRPLFQLITHERVVDSAVLEQQVAMIYNFLSGVHGQRMVRVFTFILNLVRAWPASTNGVSKMAVVELSLAVLSKLIDCNTLLMIDENLSSIIRGFERCINSEPESSEDFSCVQARRYLDYIRQRLEVGQEIDAIESNGVPVTREAFVLRRDLPGTLSAEGPRHDNDNRFISKIKILPTSEEIMSPRREYLPTTDSSQWHVPGIRGRVDREFRLLREDTVGQLRDAIHDTLARIRNVDVRADRNSKNTVRTFSYEYPTPVDIGFDSFSGMQFTIRCNQPPVLKGMTAKRRREWWMQSKRLQSGALVCVLDATGSIQFFVVAESTMRTEDDDVARKKGQRGQLDDTQPVPKELLTLSGSEEHLFVTLQLVDAGGSEIKRTLRWYRSTRSSPRRYIVEFPGVLLASFQHTLTALQRISEQPRIPFHNLIAPSNEVGQQTVIASPLYTRKAGFEFDLRLLTNDDTNLKVDPRHPPRPQALASRSSLDLTQSRALLCALTQELCLIQGPPGTGKSYTGEKIIKVLLAHKEQTKMGPILCVCYTNHALDQLLEHLLDEGVDGIIRIGSRSKSERLQNRNLRLVAKTAERTRTEGRELYLVQDAMRDINRDITKLIGDLADLESEESIKNHLRETSPLHFRQLYVAGEDDWETVTRKGSQTVSKWLRGGSQDKKQPRHLAELGLVNLLDMSHLERRKIYYHWIETLRDPIIKKITELHHKYANASEQRDRIRGDTDLRCLQQADVIGVTTTGLARQLETLRKLRSKVMVCEEAGEVLEAHILTALLPSLESAILIGDHLQLRPQIQNYELQSTNPRGQQYSLDMSLFERLVRPLHDGDVQIPFSTLETQRRMHPFMSELIRSTLYPSLMDSESVQKYQKVVGMKQRLFWFHHEHLEASAANNDPLNTSRSNDFEIEMTAALVSHLTRQGEYAQGEIAVITPYLGQLHRLRRRMESMFEICVNDRDLEDLEIFEEENLGSSVPKKPTATRKTTLLKSVRVATVDNFQGEEAKIIVISLVRSNPQNVCGFLSTSNRINVLLSRAKHGMYIIGNSNTCQHVPMWSQVMNILQAKGQFGTSLELECPRHPNTPILVSEADHFVRFSPESGCQLPCEKRLDCGHSCPSLCGEACPDIKYCQICASDQIKNFCVDFVELKLYEDINLDEEPCIFPNCGHFLTISSMDGIMQMPDHYELNMDGHPVKLLGPSAPFTMQEKGVPVCATCRGSLRSISRYGRIVRRSILDETTKRFITWSNSQHEKLTKAMFIEIEKLENAPSGTKISTVRDSNKVLTTQGSRLSILETLDTALENDRYKRIIKLRHRLNKYKNKVAREEQPFHRVATYVHSANRRNKETREFQYDDSVIQNKGMLLAESLLLKTEITAISDFISLCKSGKAHPPRAQVDFASYFKACDQLVGLANSFKYPKEQLQGHIFCAWICEFARWFSANGDKKELEAEYNEKGLGHIKLARDILESHPSTAPLLQEVDSAEAALTGHQYRQVTTDELREVYVALSGELRGTGHWYTCENGHPFTIGECGMPMEQARCPECNAPIGGQNHEAVGGMRHATEIEDLARGVRNL
ncbi:unnamed protein product [Clonostachys rosea]|uniref:C3H1-type domain-containing protein n=1 Tax=Bionectria ochroleuca TaxID=29856 RepID=A0ABY6U4A0_BIOOC|nr:unnamed protein product [Clonostachys rosea]